MYLNADTLTNKLSELAFLLKENKPDIVGVCEVLPKNFKNDIHPEYFKMEGYTIETNIHKLNETNVRGCIMYIKEGIDYKRLDINIGQKQFDEHIIIVINLSGNDKLLCSTMYRRGESPDDNNEALLKTLKHITNDMKFSHLVAMGDFNIKKIDWSNQSCLSQDTNDYSNRFLECIRDSYLFQHITEPTRQRGNDKPSTLDLVFSNEENMVNNIKYLAPLGRSDHTILNFDIICNIDTKPPQIKIQYEKGDYKKMSNHLKDIDWETELKNHPDDVDAQWLLFKEKFQDIEKECIPQKKVYINGKLNKKNCPHLLIKKA